MRILLLDNSHLPHIGGKEIVVHHLAKQYQRLGHSVRVAGAGSYRAYRHIDFGYPVQRFAKIPLLGEDAQWAFRLRWIMRNDPFDVIHAHTTHPSLYYAARYLQKTGKAIPMIVTPHGADIHKVPEVNFGKRLNPELDKKIRWALQHCDYATAISDSVRTSLVDTGMSDERIVSISNGVDAERLTTPTELDARKELGLPAGAPYFISVGNYHPRKGHETLVQAARLCEQQDIHVVIVGRKSEDFVTSVRKSDVGERVKFTGELKFPVPGQTRGPDLIAAYLQQSTGYISASMGEGTEGLSLALLEAMATGTGIIATGVSGNRDIIDNGNNGLLIKPDSAAEMAAAMDLMASDKSQRDAMGQQAQATVSPYTWEAIARQYLDLMQATQTGQDHCGAADTQSGAPYK